MPRKHSAINRTQEISDCYLKEARAILEGKHWEGKNRCVWLPGDLELEVNLGLELLEHQLDLPSAPKLTEPGEDTPDDRSIRREVRRDRRRAIEAERAARDAKRLEREAKWEREREKDKELWDTRQKLIEKEINEMKRTVEIKRNAVIMMTDTPYVEVIRRYSLKCYIAQKTFFFQRGSFEISHTEKEMFAVLLDTTDKFELMHMLELHQYVAVVATSTVDQP